MNAESARSMEHYEGMPREMWTESMNSVRSDALETINTKLDFDPSIGFKRTIGDEEFKSLHIGALVDKAREAVKEA